MEIGQPWPASTPLEASVIAARAVCAPARGSRQGSECAPCLTASSMSACQAGWNSTSSIRLPNRSWVFSTGGFSFASRPHSSGSPPDSSPSVTHFSCAHPAPSRSTASTSGTFVV